MSTFRPPSPTNAVPPPHGSSTGPAAGTTTGLRVGDPMGSFVGYLRRPKSTAAGLIAQFFGENGDDADVISALHLTKFLDTPVKVTVWMLKDHDGRVMKVDGAYPKLTEFVGLIRRPTPSVTGQLAQFFGGNGANADAINVLNQSTYLDALVYVEMHQAETGMTAQDLETLAPEDDLNAQAHRMTPSEAQEFKRRQKKADEAMQQLIVSGFFRQESVLAALGRPTDYTEWLTHQFCCHPQNQPCDRQPVVAWMVPGSGKYRAIPVCTHHKETWDEGAVEIPDGSAPLAFAQSQSIVFQHRWARHALAHALKVPDGHLPTPGAVYAWAVSHQLHGFVPGTYKAFLV